jgi:hypothetical protein
MVFVLNTINAEYTSNFKYSSACLKVEKAAVFVYLCSLVSMQLFHIVHAKEKHRWMRAVNSAHYLPLVMAHPEYLQMTNN